MNFWFHQEARIEFLESITYYESQQAGLGQRFIDAVSEAIHRIQTHPVMYRLVRGKTYRQCRIPKFPFGIIYRIKNKHIEIIAVMHLHRNPGYWKRRDKDI